MNKFFQTTVLSYKQIKVNIDVTNHKYFKFLKTYFKNTISFFTIQEFQWNNCRIYNWYVTKSTIYKKLPPPPSHPWIHCDAYTVMNTMQWIQLICSNLSLLAGCLHAVWAHSVCPGQDHAYSAWLSLQMVAVVISHYSRAVTS